MKFRQLLELWKFVACVDWKLHSGLQSSSLFLSMKINSFHCLLVNHVGNVMTGRHLKTVQQLKSYLCTYTDVSSVNVDVYWYVDRCWSRVRFPVKCFRSSTPPRLWRYRPSGWLGRKRKFEKSMFIFTKWGIAGLFFNIFYFSTVDSQYVKYKILLTDLNRGSLVLEAITLPTEPQQQPHLGTDYIRIAI